VNLLCSLVDELRVNQGPFDEIKIVGPKDKVNCMVARDVPFRVIPVTSSQVMTKHRMSHLVSDKKFPPGPGQAHNVSRVVAYANAVRPCGPACWVREPPQLERKIAKGWMRGNQA
jgi:hypothetical protein